MRPPCMAKGGVIVPPPWQYWVLSTVPWRLHMPVHKIYFIRWILDNITSLFGSVFTLVPAALVQIQAKQTRDIFQYSMT